MFDIKCSSITLLINILFFNVILLNICTTYAVQDLLQTNKTHSESDSNEGNVDTFIFGTDEIFANVSPNIKGINESLNTYNENVARKFQSIQNEINDIKISSTSVKNDMNSLKDLLHNLTSALPARLSEITNALLKQINEIETNIKNSTTALDSDLVKTLDHQPTKLHESPTSFTCTDIYTPLTEQKIGIYNIYVTGLPPFPVLCAQDITNLCAWTVIQQRVNGAISFDRDWNAYKKGFGDLNSNFFIGLEKLHALTHATTMILAVTVYFNPQTRPKYAGYDHFAIGNESTGYIIQNLGAHSGTLGDWLTTHKGHRFYTKDRDNESSCAKKYAGGWWYTNCYTSNLNGPYEMERIGSKTRGIHWGPTNFQFNYSLHGTQMAIRPKSCAPQ